MWQETIEIEGPYNFDRILDRLSMDPLNALDLDKRTIHVPIKLNDEAFTARVTAIGTTEQPSFVIEAESGDKARMIKRLSEVFQWEVPLKDIHDHFGKTDLNLIFEEHVGTPLILDFDPFGCLLKCIIHQQLNMAFAIKLTGRFVKKYGFEKDGAWFYPDPETVAALTVEELRELQFSGRKAEYVIDIAKAVTEAGLDLEALKQEDEQIIFDRLIKIRGIGAWTIQNFLLFGLGRQNLFPMADIGIQNALKKLYNLEKKPTYEEMERYKTGWEPYLSYASLYLWRSIE
ncbi:DNA-3-methyladenine glycosylase [Bacillus sp. FJAT-27225]|uniref:DNA-3-methyladenine glycosylase family protein n=1 Tax=Bacillus sp. FJAT-27225 TaxID=1743144 RepID=UPI00080C2F54|nr:DNA-3-methyladenine glycosylase [Bacillus sp. FJAT-27225]OCA83128.1 DNA-3-methyladenine glycosylase [Bacillus sp. FJAT-27225]